MLKHKHADLMLLYAQDAAKTDKPWELWEYSDTCDGDNFFPLYKNPSWSPENKYRRIKDKTDLGKYGVEKGDVWTVQDSRDHYFIEDANPLLIRNLRSGFQTNFSVKDGLSELLFRRGVIDKL